MMVVESGNIRQFLVDERDALTFPITRCNGKPTIVWHVGDLVSLSIEVLVAKALLEHRKSKR